MDRLPLFFYRYLSARMLVSIANNSFMVFFLWEIVVVYKSVFLAGLLPTISLAADLLTAIPVGHLIDRFNSTHLSMVASLLLVIGIALLFFGQILTIVYITTFFVSLSLMMKGDTISATAKKHLKDDQFINSIRLISGAGYASTLIGTAIGGISILYLRQYFPIMLMAFAVFSLVISFPIEEEKEKRDKKTAISELASSFGFIRKIAGFLAVGFVLNGLLVSLDVYSSGLFHLVLDVSAVYYTIFIAVLSVGGIIGAALVGRIQKHIDSAFRISSMIVLFSPAMIYISLSRNAIGDILDSFAIGVLISFINIPLQAKLMKIVPRNIYGKVMAFLRVFLGGATPAMAAVFAFIALFLNVDSTLFYIGIIVFPITVLAFVVLPKFMAMETSSDSGGAEVRPSP